MPLQYALGVIHQRGTGVPKAETEAVQWFRGAADQACLCQHALAPCMPTARGSEG
jgi:TPR repeat protein